MLCEGIGTGKGFVALFSKSEDKVTPAGKSRLAWSRADKGLLSGVRTDVRDQCKTRGLSESTAAARGPFTSVV